MGFWAGTNGPPKQVWLWGGVFSQNLLGLADQHDVWTECQEALQKAVPDILWHLRAVAQDAAVAATETSCFMEVVVSIPKVLEQQEIQSGLKAIEHLLALQSLGRATQTALTELLQRDPGYSAVLQWVGVQKSGQVTVPFLAAAAAPVPPTDGSCYGALALLVGAAATETVQRLRHTVKGSCVESMVEAGRLLRPVARGPSWRQELESTCAKDGKPLGHMAAGKVLLDGHVAKSLSSFKQCYQDRTGAVLDTAWAWLWGFRKWRPVFRVSYLEGVPGTRTIPILLESIVQASSLTQNSRLILRVCARCMCLLKLGRPFVSVWTESSVPLASSWLHGVQVP